IGLEEGVLTYSRTLDSPAEIEGERRLLFAGITRAEQILTLSMAHNRTQNGQTQAAISSRFLRNMESIERVNSSGAAIDSFDDDQSNTTISFGSRGVRSAGRASSVSSGWQKKTSTAPANPGWKKIDPAAGAYSTKPAPARSEQENFGSEITYEYADNALHKGQMVRHGSFGLGKIEELIAGPSPKAVVNFQRFGRKTLILEYAKLQPV
ncbi:MAG: hypothetical protein JXM68_05650, partial [Sedimentisphaerales bacterium]|nr:hypothetical protein [Sedimentisphaerales bacterium]